MLVEACEAQIANLRVSFLASGSGDESLVLLHGGMMSANSWLWFIESFSISPAGRNARVYALDLPGFGNSDKPSEGLAYSYARQAEIVTGFVEGVVRRETPNARISAVGHSMGGGILLHLLMQCPSPFHRVAILSTGLRPASGPGAVNAQTEQTALPSGSTEFLRRYIAGWFHRPNPDIVDRLVSEALKMSEASYAGVLEAVRSYDQTPWSHRFPALIPLIVGRGSFDRSRSRQEVEEVAKLIPNGALRNFSRSGHCPHIEEPNAVASWISDWLMAEQLRSQG